MKITNKLLCLILSVVVVFSLFGCEKEEKQTVLLETVETVTSLDPQLADNKLEKQIVANIYCGLFSLDENGNAQKAIATEYTLSADGKTYLFTLSDKYVWQDGRPVTAHDFEYALKRATEPQLNAPNAYLLKNIKNAKKILGGKLPSSALGVNAENDYKLKITLNSPDGDFTKILATAVCMPCNSDFLESTKGYYGLKEDCVAYNGKFALTDWNDEYLKLTQNENSVAVKNSKYKSVYVYFNDEEELMQNLSKGETDFTFSDYDYCRKLKAQDIEFTSTSVSNTVYSLVALKSDSIFDDRILKALMATAEFEISESDAELFGIKKTDTVLPENISSDAAKITDDCEKYKSDAENMFFESCTENSVDATFPTLNIGYVKSDFTENTAMQIAASWQKRFGITVNIKEYSSFELLQSSENSGECDFVIVSVGAETAHAPTFFEQFSTLEIFKNSEIDFSDLSKQINAIRKATTDAEKYKNCDNAAKTIVNSPRVLPLFQTSDIYIFGELFPQRPNAFDYTVAF